MEQKKYEQKPLEGTIWCEENTFKTRDGRDFTVLKGSLTDENGKQFYIDAYVNYTKTGKKLLSLKLKSVESVNKEKAIRNGQQYAETRPDDIIPF